MDSVTLEEMKKELKENGYKNVDEMPTHKIIELWQSQ
jgi:hypothetical protein